MKTNTEKCVGYSLTHKVIEVINVTYLADAEYYLYHCCRKGRQAFDL